MKRKEAKKILNEMVTLSYNNRGFKPNLDSSEKEAIKMALADMDMIEKVNYQNLLSEKRKLEEELYRIKAMYEKN